MNYTTLESEIVARIVAKAAAGVTVVPLPEHDPDVAYPSGAAGHITVAYQSSEFQDPETTDIVAQPEKIIFQLIVRSRKLRGTTGIYPLLAAIKSALLGWQSTMSDKIQFSKATFTSHESGVWTYLLTLSTMGLAIEEPDDEELVTATLMTAKTTNYEDIVVESQIEE